MNLAFEASMADGYRGATQKIRVLSEHWVAREFYCPNCEGKKIGRHPNNHPAGDFYCLGCGEQFELKSQKAKHGPTIPDGDYAALINRAKGNANPNLLLMNYDSLTFSVRNLILIPKHFLIPDAIAVRKPLAPTARRAGWIGCKILLHRIPHAGRIFLVENKIIQPPHDVRAIWRRALFLRGIKAPDARGWLVEVMRCIEKIGEPTFKLEQVYAMEAHLKAIYPGNQHIRPKIRQQLQMLRDNGYLEFLGRGTYRLAG